MNKTPENLKIFTIEDIRSWKPCYDPSRHLAESWSGTVVDLLKINAISPQDRLWVVCREELISAKTLRLFAVWCARQVEHLMTDERSIAALVVAEKFAHGEATKVELAAARDAAGAAARDAAGAAARAAARDAARDAAGAAARDAAGAAARAAARDAARAAAGAAAWDAARDAAGDAAWAAARAAAWAAAWAAARAARAAAWAAAGDAQVKQLLKMMEEK